MKESSTYQAIVEEGRLEGAVREARKVLRIVGDRQFSPPDAQTATAIEQINDLTRLEDLCERVLTASSWQELLGMPVAGQRRGRRRPAP